MQIFSNAGQDESHRIEEEVQPYVKGPVPGKLPFHDVWCPFGTSRANSVLENHGEFHD